MIMPSRMMLAVVFAVGACAAPAPVEAPKNALSDVQQMLQQATATSNPPDEKNMNTSKQLSTGLRFWFAGDHGP